jgi:predicted nuclease of predicted toxin-antitoxin system
MMFLANENFPRPSLILLRDNGFEVKSIQEESPGISDEVVMKIASEMNLIILTFDSDYGELIFKHSKDNPPAVVYFREKGPDPLFAGKLLLNLLSKDDISISNSFTVVEEKNIRQRFYKS